MVWVQKAKDVARHRIYKGLSMSIQIFTSRGADGRTMRLPSAYRRKVKWLPQISDIFPNFNVATTQGDIDFWSWAEGSWVFLFSHPAAKTPVCTTEISALSNSRAPFDELGLKTLGLSGSSLDCQHEWHEEIERVFKTEVWFPVAEDRGGQLASLFGMRHAKEHANWPIRKSFILDQQMRIRMIFEYPVYIGRCVEETLRVVEALQLHDRTGFGTPSDWYEGDPVIIPNTASEADVIRELGVPSHMILPYLRIAQPNSRARKEDAA
jgi:peroxiredoxin (alkyl hydroperoxide reductase subunit C)